MHRQERRCHAMAAHVQEVKTYMVGVEREDVEGISRQLFTRLVNPGKAAAAHLGSGPRQEAFLHSGCRNQVRFHVLVGRHQAFLEPRRLFHHALDRELGLHPGAQNR